MTEKIAGESKGLLASLAALIATLVAIIHTRLNLLSTDIEEYRGYLLTLLALTFTALFFLGMGVLLATILLIAIFWETHRLLVLGSLTGFFLTAGLITWGIILYKIKTTPKLFATSLSELAKDRQSISPL